MRQYYPPHTHTLPLLPCTPTPLTPQAVCCWLLLGWPPAGPAPPGPPKAQRHLVIHGSVRCDYSGWHWQLPYVVLVGLLIAVPVGLPMVAAWARRSGSSGLGVEGASGSESCMEDVRNGLRRRALVDA